MQRHKLGGKWSPDASVWRSGAGRSLPVCRTVVQMGRAYELYKYCSIMLQQVQRADEKTSVDIKYLCRIQTNKKRFVTEVWEMNSP